MKETAKRKLGLAVIGIVFVMAQSANIILLDFRINGIRLEYLRDQITVENVIPCDTDTDCMEKNPDIEF